MDEDLKKCSKFKTISSKCNFHKNKNRKDGLQSLCKFCVKDYYLKNIDKIILKTKDGSKNIPEKVKIRKKNNEQNKEMDILKTNEKQMLNFV